MFGIQPIHIIVVVIVALLIFGPERLPQMGRDLARTLNEFRKGADQMTRGFTEEVSKPLDQAMADPVLCANCNAINPGGAAFCNKCGTKLASHQ